MGSHFRELFSRSKYSAGEFPQTPPTGNSSLGRRHNERERFTGAALGFCLQHDIPFRVAFFNDLGIETSTPEDSLLIIAERHHWADLLIVTRREVHVFEVKMGADIKRHQNPDLEYDNPNGIEEFWKQDKGYGWKLIRYSGGRKPKYWKLGWPQESKRKIENGVQIGSISWNRIAMLPGGSVSDDFKNLLASNHLIPSSLMKDIDPSHRTPLAETAAQTAQILSNVFADFGLPYSGIESDFSKDGWWFQSKLNRLSARQEQRFPHVAHFFKQLDVPEGEPALWLGYEKNFAWESVPFRCVWFNCSAEGKAELKRRLDKLIPEDGPDEEGFSLLVRSTDCDADEKWFADVLTLAGLVKQMS